VPMQLRLDGHRWFCALTVEPPALVPEELQPFEGISVQPTRQEDIVMSGEHASDKLSSSSSSSSSSKVAFPDAEKQHNEPEAARKGWAGLWHALTGASSSAAAPTASSKHARVLKEGTTGIRMDAKYEAEVPYAARTVCDAVGISRLGGAIQSSSSPASGLVTWKNYPHASMTDHTKVCV
jgi:hypothetical protein